MESRFVNFSFDHCGVHLVALDLVPRVPADPSVPGVDAQADLHAFEGGTWPWLADDLAAWDARGGGDVLVFAHHPILDNADWSLDDAGWSAVEDLLAAEGSSIRVFFGGHVHMDLAMEVGGVPVIATPAAKEGSFVRIVTVAEDGSLDWDTLLSQAR